MSSQALLLLPEGKLKNSAAAVCESNGIEVQTCPDLAKLSEVLEAKKINVVLVAETQDKAKIEDLLKQINASSSKPSAAVALNEHSMKRALELMNAGAWDCLEPDILDSDLEKILKEGVKKSESAPVRFPPKIPFWKKKWFTIGAASFFALLLLGTFLKIRHDRKEKIRKEKEAYSSEMRFPLPYSHPSGIVFQDNYFWISDWYAQSIYKHEPSLNGLVMLSVFHLSDINPIAIAWAENHLWVLSANHKIRKFAVSDKLKLRQSTQSPGNNPSGMAFDGKNLWTSDTGTKKVYRHVLDAKLTVNGEFDYPGTPVALFSEEGLLWSLDGDTNKLMRHRIALNKLAVEKYLPVSRPELKRVGATFDGKRFWTLSENPPEAIRHEIESE